MLFAFSIHCFSLVLRASEEKNPRLGNKGRGEQDVPRQPDELGAQVAHDHRPLVPLTSETSDQLLGAFKLPTARLNLVL